MGAGLATVASMTGSASLRGATEHGALLLAVRSVNGRGLALKQRLPGSLQIWEREIEKGLRQRFARGSFQFSLTVEAPPESSSTADDAIDSERFAQVSKTLISLALSNGLELPTVRDVVTFPGVVRTASQSASSSEPQVSDKLPPQVAELVDALLSSLDEDRRREGEATRTAMRALVAELRAEFDAVRVRIPQIVGEYRARLLQRVEQFLQERGHQVEPEAVAREVAVFAERSDTAEEVQRLEEHLTELDRQLSEGGEIGRRLEFLLQEVLREVNTLGSKASDAETARRVVEMKTRIDRLKEQAANLE